MDVFKGDVKELRINKVSLSKSLKVLEFNDTVIRKDDSFYKNKFNRMVNFYDDTYLFTRSEAREFLLQNYGTSCIFVDYEELHFDKSISRDEFKEFKKYYKKVKEANKND